MGKDRIQGLVGKLLLQSKRRPIVAYDCINNNGGGHNFADKAKPTDAADRLNMRCEENERIKGNSQLLTSTDRWYDFP